MGLQDLLTGLTGADANRVLEIALLHDAGEARAGDITPHDGVAVAEKHRRERDAVAGIFGALAGGDVCLARWEEYERCESLEARIVRQVDRLEMALQALAYERQGAGDLTEFFDSARKALTSPELNGLLVEIEKLRR